MKGIKSFGNTLVVNGVEVIFEHRISKIECVRDIYLVLLEVPKGITW